MATSLWDLLGKYKVVIPIVQRDYAQGRQTEKIQLIRNKFLDSLYAAIDNTETLELDFVYGYIKEDENESRFIPLDGQQRLTTLFLLHWFIAVKESKLEEAKKRLLNFTYETRHSSRVFCEELIKRFKTVELNTGLTVDEAIINQSWFFTAWKNDPTISSMLTMLKDIQEKFQNTENIWSFLIADQPHIVFHLLPMEKLGLPDDLYIKMNSRGKELTEFEHFKSRFSEILNHEQAVIFNDNIDQKWSDLFWNLHKDTANIDIAKLVDNSFLRFFNYVTDVLNAQQNINADAQFDKFEVYRNVYENNPKNVEFLFSCLDEFSSIYKTNPKFFDSFFYIKSDNFHQDKTRLFFQNSATDLFKKCADSYDTTQQNNPFSVGEQLLLYAFIVHLINNTTDFNSRLRTLRNLIIHSDSVRKENMQSLLKTVEDIILNNKVNDDSRFSITQVKEEEAKQVFIIDNSILKTTIYKLEDHDLLRGCLAIFTLQNNLNDYATAFQKIFTCDYETISKALLTFGDYSQKYNWLRRLGNRNESVWRELFTPSQRRSDFKNTINVLHALLDHLIQNPQSNLEIIIDDYLNLFKKDVTKPKDWKFYYIKYESFRGWNGQSTDGFYYWEDIENKQYEMVMMFAKQFNGRHWSPFLLTLKKLNETLQLKNYGHPLILVKGDITLKIFNVNNGFKLESSDVESKKLLDTLKVSGNLNSDDIFQIRQNEKGVDIDDRIEKFLELTSTIETLNTDGMPNVICDKNSEFKELSVVALIDKKDEEQECTTDEL